MKKSKSNDGGVIKPEIEMVSNNSKIFIKELSHGEEVENTEFSSVEVKLKVREPSEEIKYLMKEIFNIKFNYDTLLNFTCQLLSHEQHVKFAAKKKEIFG